MEAATDVKGTCLSMCPEKEIVMREREGLLSPFEIYSAAEDGNTRNPAKSRPRADRTKVVKQYSRSAAGRTTLDPSLLRPAPVLKETVAYLFCNIVPKDHPAWTSVYDFVFDRLRAVRQDMVMQGIVGRDAICVLEQAVRFHLFASYRLRDADAADFDPVINKQHLLECLKRLLYHYKVTPGEHRHREEFEAIYLLDNLGDSHALLHCLGLPEKLRRLPLVRQCYKISLAFVLRNYSRALRLISRLPSPMCLCAVNPQLDNLRVNYLQILSAGYSVKNCKYPVEKLKEQLALNSAISVVDLCSKCGLIDLFDHPDPAGPAVICFNKSAFKRPQVGEKPTTLLPLDSVLQGKSVSALLIGNTDKSPDLSQLTTTADICGEIPQTIAKLEAMSLGTRAKPENADFSRDLGSRCSGTKEGEERFNDSTSGDLLRTQEVQGIVGEAELDRDGGGMKTEENLMLKLSDMPRNDFMNFEENGKINTLVFQSNYDSGIFSPVSSLCNQRRGRGRGVRGMSQGGNCQLTPGKGRGRGRGRGKLQN